MIRTLWLLPLILLAACSTTTTERHSTAAADAEFTRLAEEYLTGYLAWRPLLAVNLGLHEHDGKMGDYRRASLDAEHARLKRYRERLAQLDTTRLGREASLDHRLLCAAIAEELGSFEDTRSYFRNPMTYASAFDVSVYIKRDFAPLERRARCLVAILGEVPAVMAAARTNLDDALPRPFVENAIQMTEGMVQFLEQDLVLALQGVTNSSLRLEFESANRRAANELRRYADWLRDVKLPKAHNQYALGVEKFSRLLREQQLISLPPERILAIAQRELQREQQVFAETAGRIDSNRPAIEVFRAIQRDHPTAKSLLPDARKNLEEIRQFVTERRLVTIPSEVRVRVEETPQFDRANSFASMNTPGPFETQATEAYYYVTPVEPQWTPQQQEEWLTAFNYYTMDVVSIHEAYPGHYVQFLCLRSSRVPRWRKVFENYGFVEGWAHYAERLMLDEGFGAGGSANASTADPLRAAKYRLAQSDEALLRLCRLCVSIQMHCQRMTVDEATRFFRENCYYEEKPARQEAVRGTYDPGYGMYTLGKLMILKLRDDYRQQEGAAFTLQKFHDELLRHGMPPIRLLRESMLKQSSLWDEVL